MSGIIEKRLANLGIVLPDAPAPVANYQPYVVAGNFVFLSGQVTLWNGEIRYLGKIGDELSVEEGYQAARMCGLNLIAQVRAACQGDLGRVRQVVRLGAFVNCVEGFSKHPQVVDGASDLMAEVFGDQGRCTRTNIGVPSLPLGFAVEIDGIFEIE